MKMRLLRSLRSLAMTPIRHRANLCVAIALVFAFSSALYSNTGTAEILNITPGARQIGMSEAFTGVADDITALQYNPAGLSRTTARQFLATFNKGPVDISAGFVGYALPLKEGKTGFGAGLTYLDGGSIELNYSDRPSQTKKAQQDYLLNLVYSKAYGEKFSAGIAIKYLRSTLLEEASGSAACLDIGLLWMVKRYNAKAGVVLQNIGPDLKYSGGLASGNVGDRLPFTVRAGVSRALTLKSGKPLTIGLDGVFGNWRGYYGAFDIGKFETWKDYFSFKRYYGNIGAEYELTERFTLRAGYRGGYNFSAFSAGFGIKSAGATIDYGIAYLGDLGLTHYVSFSRKMN